MLRPGGQFIFNAFEEVFTDEAFENLDKGKWRKYENFKALSPFYKFQNPLEEYRKLVEELQFVNCPIYSENFKMQFLKEDFDGNFSPTLKYFMLYIKLR